VDALVAAIEGDGLDLLVGAGEEFFGALDAHALEFVTGSTAKMLEEGLVEAAAGHGGNSNEVLDADGFVAVFPDVAEAAGDALVLNGKDVAAFADDDAGGGHADGLGRRFAAVHEVVEQFSTAKTEDFQ